MLSLSKKAMFALEAVVDIAYHARTEPVQSKDITSRQGIPQRYLEQVMQKLVHAGILKGVRGPRGGYHLARERRRITVGEVVRVIDALETHGNGSGYESRSAIGNKVIYPLLQQMQEQLYDRLDGITMQEMCDRVTETGIDRAVDQHLDFTI